MNITPIINQMIVLFLMMAAGYIANKVHIMDKNAEKVLSRVIVNVTNPLLIISSVVSGDRLDSTAMLLVAFAAAITYFLVMPFVGKAIAKLMGCKGNRAAEWESMLLYSNLGFIGIPVVNAILGPSAILYLSIFMAVFNVSVFSYGNMLLGGSGEGGFRLSSLFSAGSVSAVIAVLLYLLHAQIPAVLMTTVQSLGSITTPLAMLVIGSSLAEYPIREMFQDRSVLPFTLIRLLGLPLLTLVLCRWILPDPLLLGVTVIASALPVASTVVMLSTQSGRDTAFITRAVFFSTLFSLVTIPLIAMVLQLWS